MKIYLASRIGRRTEMFRYIAELEIDGHEVTSRWITDEPPQLASDDERHKWAQLDVEDVLAADTLMAFTEFPGTIPGRARGGRHVEFGLAYHANKRLMIVGPRENIFHWLPGVEVYEDFEQAKAALL